ncbi:hypothetical protein GEMRC1_013216 [Eukaryota sp. GEM-RC1]
MNRRIAEYANKTDENAFYGITKFADLSQEEFQQRYLTLKQSSPPSGEYYVPPTPTTNMVPLPPMWDWRKSLGVSMVTPVKNQGSCGSCWAFSACASAESFLMIHPKGNEEPNPYPDLDVNSLSPQAMVDCVPASAGCQGCQGGLPTWAYMHMIRMGWGHPGWMQYPYKGTDRNPCLIKSKPAMAKKYKGYSDINPNFNWTQHDNSGITAEDYCAAVYRNSPLATALDASGLQWYVGGVISSSAFCSWRINHAVTSVGYEMFTGTIPEDKKHMFEAPQPNPINWNMMVNIIKNSWGEDFGEEGYFRIWLTNHIYPINPNAKDWGLCGGSTVFYADDEFILTLTSLEPFCFNDQSLIFMMSKVIFVNYYY